MLSAVILSHNDEVILGRAIRSVGFCDEVVVIDDDSTDGTREVAKKLGAKVYQRPLGSDFSKQRNFGLSKATGSWVLFVDSDEVVTAELAKEMKEAISNSSDTAGYYLKRRDTMWGRVLRFGETGRIKLLRLARKDAGSWRRPVHEVWDIRGTIGELTHSLDHFPHPNVAQFIDEINRYSTINARYLYEKGIRVAWWHIVAYPKAKFLVNYIWRLGFLDGTAGAVVALLMSLHSFLTRGKLWLLQSEHHR